MYILTMGGRSIGIIDKFAGNNPAERWVAFRPRENGDHGTYPARSRGFPTRTAAVKWLQASDASDGPTSGASDETSERSSDKTAKPCTTRD